LKLNKPLVYISSIGFFALNNKTVSETTEDPSEFALKFLPGYSQTKFIADKLVRQAISRGYPAIVIRPADIAGHSKTGALNETDMVVRLISGIIQLNKAPLIDKDTIYDITPVDFVSKSICELCKQPNSMGNVFNIVNPVGSPPFNTILKYIQSFGYKLEYIDFNTWKKCATEACSKNNANSLAPIITFFKSNLPIAPHYEVPSLYDILKVPPPFITEEIFHKYLIRLQKRNIIPNVN